MSGPISVIIPAYNGERFLADAVRSVWDQTARPAELIVVDDCSRDGTAALAERLAGRSPVPMRVVRLPRNTGGPSGPINAGVRVATGELVAVLDQDDLFLPDRLERHAALLAACPSAGLAFGSCVREGGGNWQGPELVARLVAASEPLAGGPAGAVRMPGPAAVRLLLIQNNIALGYPGFTFRRAAWAAAGGVDEGLRIAGDYDFLFRLAVRGDFAYLPDPGYVRREHADNATRDRMRMNLECARVRARYLRAHPGLCGDPEVRAALRGWFAGLGYWAREGGRPRTASWLYGIALWRLGWDRGAALGLAKVWPVWAARALLRHPPHLPPGHPARGPEAR